LKPLPLWLKNTEIQLQPFYVFSHLSTKFELFKPLKMKKFITLFMLLSAFLFVGAQSTITPEDHLELKEAEHDFTKIPQGKPVYYTFEIVNKGTTELKLDDVHASCGCTTPEWSRDPIAPGATGKIRVGYNAAAEGPFEKFITITYNTTLSKQLKIKGQVWKAPDGAAPANASIEFFKKQTF
jgi:hypothetical protein